MKKTYNSLKKLLYIILLEILFIAFFGTIAFCFMYIEDSYTLYFPHIITILFFALILCALATSVVYMFKANNLGISKIKKKYNLTRFSSAFCAIMMIILFIYESVIAIVRSDLQPLYYAFRMVRWLLTLPACAYFIIELIPKKIKRNKVVIPKPLKILTSVSVILFAVFSLFTIYFSPLLANDISKISHIVVYAFIALFFLFQGQIENSIPKFKPYILIGLFTSIVATAFPLSISLAKIIGRFSVLAGYSQPEHIVCVAIGIYSFTKMFAILSTMYDVSELRADDRHHHHHHHHSSEGEEK